ncbi:MAG TPA: LysR family transcriptional regulator [Aliidongia sp.]|uniref:LysR family transcriptional regulator n=1 Tax=Aliidongia sp. TaxID=1914230 RepID=UPI002DDD71E2|nr:LysR family transcriptional regulator [Aliidongia sp.]HEV2674960.1 LysR family transcriptional regulator [Aliidongia sp.]
MEWSDLRIFLAIAREGTLGAAARKLGQSQPTMGRRLRALEQAVGQTLFQRTGEGFVLTDEGAAVLSHAERIEEEALAFERQLAGQDRQLDGMLRLSSSDWFGVHLLTPVLAEFATLQPRVVVELLTDARLYSLPRREADMVFRIKPFDEPEVVSRRLMHIGYGVYLKAGLAPPRAGDGTGTPLITMDTAFGGMPDAVWLARMLPNAHVVSRSNNRDIQARMCARGAGVAVLPRPLGDGLPGVERIDLGEAPPGRDTWVGYHRDLKRLARLRALLDLMIERLAN